MRGATAGDSTGSPSSTTPMTSFRGFSSISLRRHQVASLEPSSEAELHLLDLLHSHLTDSLQSLLPKPPSSSPSSSLTLSLPFLHKLLDALLACESDFKSLLLLVLSRNPSLLSRPPLDRALPDLLDRSVKSLDLCNAVSLSLLSLRLWTRHADIAASALHRPPGCGPPQISRARRALSKLLPSARAGLTPSSSSCRRMCRICSAKRHLHAVASGFASPRTAESGSASVLALAVQTISTLLHFSMWMMVASFPCGGEEIHPPPPIPASARHMPWASALARLHERIGEEMRRGRKEGGLLASAGMLEETLAVERSGREVLEMANSGEGIEEAAAAQLVIASRKLEEGLGPFERKVREVFHRLVRCREEVICCLGDGSSSCTFSSLDSV